MHWSGARQAASASQWVIGHLTASKNPLLEDDSGSGRLRRVCRYMTTTKRALLRGFDGGVRYSIFVANAGQQCALPRRGRGRFLRLRHAVSLDDQCFRNKIESVCRRRTVAATHQGKPRVFRNGGSVGALDETLVACVRRSSIVTICPSGQAFMRLAKSSPMGGRRCSPTTCSPAASHRFGNLTPSTASTIGRWEPETPRPINARTEEMLSVGLK